MQDQLTIRIPKIARWGEYDGSGYQLGKTTKNKDDFYYDFTIDERKNRGYKLRTEQRFYSEDQNVTEYITHRQTLIKGRKCDKLIREVQKQNHLGGKPDGKVYKSVEILDKQGNRTITRFINRKYIDTREFPVLNRQFSTKGWKAILEKLALNIGTDVNGCERPFLRKLAGRIFDLARKSI